MITLGARTISVVTLFAEDLPETMAFYQDIFGLEQVYTDEVSAVYNFGNMSINLLHISEAPELIDPAAVAGRAAGSRFQFTIRVEDVDAICDGLSARGVSLLNGPMNRPWGIRTACFADPAGHIWELAQELG